MSNREIVGVVTGIYEGDFSFATVSIDGTNYLVGGEIFQAFLDRYPVGTSVKVEVRKDGTVRNVVKQ